MYDGLDEYYVTVSEKIQRKEKHTQEEIHRKLGAALHQHIVIPCETWFQIPFLYLTIIPHNLSIRSHLRLQRSLSWIQRLLMAWIRSQHAQRLRLQHLQRLKEQAKRVRFGDVWVLKCWLFCLLGKWINIYLVCKYSDWKLKMTTCLKSCGMFFVCVLQIKIQAVCERTFKLITRSGQTKTTLKKFLDSMLQKIGKIRSLLKDLKANYAGSSLMTT